MDNVIEDSLRLLEDGALEVEGRLVVASNATFLCDVTLDGVTASCVYKPIRGERPLWDFPHGSLAAREVATYLLSAASGYDLVPPTVLRDGPFGRGMCQLWIEHDPDVELVDVVPPNAVPPGWLQIIDAYDGEGAEVTLVHADDERLRLLSTFDVVINNADRKAGHVIVDERGQVFGVDHGVCLHEDDKLRTVLWGWAGEPLSAGARELLDRLACAVDGPLTRSLRPLLEPAELAGLRGRIRELRQAGVHPEPSTRWPAIPWPVF